MKESVAKQVKRINRKLSKLEKKQIPFATSQALNDSAFEARKDLQIEVARQLDRPTPFTVKAFQVERSTKRRLKALVFVEGKRAYLENVIFGLNRTGNIGVPVNKRLNKYGNIPGKKTGYIKKGNQFIATIRGVRGVWQREKGRGLTLLVRFHDSVKHKERFGFENVVFRTVKRSFFPFYQRRLSRAVATMK